jgi:adenylosuccinate lyase
MVLWHERDLTNSSAERFILPHVMVLSDEILVKMEQVFSGLVVNEKNMLRNIESANGMIMAEPVMMALVSKGIGRQDAHEIVRTSSMKAEETGKSFKDMLLKDKQVAKLIKKEELEKVMDPKNYIGVAPELTDKVVEKAKIVLAKK